MDTNIRIPKRKEPLDEVSLTNDTQRILHLQSHSPRAFNTVSENFMGVENITQSLFGRKHQDLKEVILHILFECCLKSMLTLRCVSKGFFDLVSSETPLYTKKPCSPLSERAGISFEYSQCSAPHSPLLQEKFDFAHKEQMEMHITISVHDFLNRPRALNIIEENKLKIILKIETQNAIDQLSALFSNHPYPRFIDKIKEFDFQNIKVNASTISSVNRLLNTVAQNIHGFANLTSLIIGDIENEVVFNLPDLLNGIKKLTIGNIYYHASVHLSDAFFNLTSLFLGHIGNEPNSIFSFPTEPFKFTKRLPNLINLNIGSIAKGITLNLPIALDKLEDLSIGLIEGTVDVPDCVCSDYCPNLINLKLVDETFINVNLCSFPNLRNLNFSHIEIGLLHYKSDSNSISLKGSFSKLTNLTIDELEGSYSHGKKLYFSLESQPNLLNLTIREINGYTQVSLSGLPRLTTLSISHITETTRIILPKSLNNLTGLNINGHEAIFRLPTIMGGLKIFIIETVHDEVTRKLLNKINARLNCLEGPVLRPEGFFATISNIMSMLGGSTALVHEEQIDI